MQEHKLELNVDKLDKGNEQDVASLIDKMMEGGVSRLKLKTSEEMDSGEIFKEYHHGRCDINSPYSCGTPYDVLE